MMRQYDAIVIGGGPAGALTGLHLADLGWHVLLIDRRRPGSPKTCGHCLNPRALPMLERAGLAKQTLDLARGESHTFQLHLDNAPAWSIELPSRQGEERGLLVERSRFDTMLLDAARDRGVTIAQPATARITVLQRGSSSVAVRTQHDRFEARAPLLIGADGLNSRVAREAGLAPRSRQFTGTKFGFSFAFRSQHASLMERGCIGMFILKGGYLGLINQGDAGLHVASLVNSAQSGLPRSPHDVAARFAARFDLLHRLGLGEIASGMVKHSCGAAPMPWQPHAAASDRAVLVGDAAGYIEPFTGEGMTWAIESAELLADVLANCAPGKGPGTWTTRIAKRYRAVRSATIERRQHRCRMIAWLAARPHLLRFAARRLQRRTMFSEELLRRVVPA